MAEFLVKQWLAPWLRAQHITDTAPFERWMALMTTAEMAPGQCFISAGETSDRICIIHRGMVRLYYTTPEGKERNKAFYSEGDLTGALSAAMTSRPAPFSIEALEPTQAVIAPYQSIRDVAAIGSELGEVFVRLLSQAFIRNEQREAMLLTCNAEQRYRWLQDNEPDLLARVPQFHIASYLGVDPVSLSRLKRKLNA